MVYNELGHMINAKAVKVAAKIGRLSGKLIEELLADGMSIIEGRALMDYLKAQVDVAAFMSLAIEQCRMQENGKRLRSLMPESKPKWYGVYSSHAAKLYGSSIWRQLDGSEVEITSIYYNPSNPMRQWPDAKCLGEVAQFIRVGCKPVSPAT